MVAVLVLTSRACFDPRAEHQCTTTITQSDIIDLAVGTNYNCGIVNLLIEKNTVPIPNIEDVALTEDVVTSEDPKFPKSLKQIIFELEDTITFNELVELSKITVQEKENLENATRGQSSNNEWLEHREFRVTASRMHDVVHKVSDDFIIKNPEK